jgi:small GTP-binding protein
MEREYKWKIILLGDFAVGKTSLVRRFVYDEFSDHYLTTIGVKVTKKVMQVGGASVALLLWDVAGNDRFIPMSAEYMRGCAGGIIVCDVTRTPTISHVHDHIAALRAANGAAEYVIAVNKSDLADGKDAAAHPMDDPGSLYFPGSGIAGDAGSSPGAGTVFVTSALNGSNVQAMFQGLVDKLMKGRAS